MIRVQFSLRTVLILMAACCLLLAWWVPTDDEVRFAHIHFTKWRPSIAPLRITTARQFFDVLGYEPGQEPDFPEWPDFSKSDVIPVPLNGLAGEPTAEYRVEALAKPVSMDFRNTPLREVVEVLQEREENDWWLQIDLRGFALDGVDPDLPITFHAEEVPLRNALHSMLEPRNLTFVVGDEMVCIITQRSVGDVYGLVIIDRGDWLDSWRPELRHRLRMGGKLVFITSFAGSVPTDSRAVGYTVPKGAKVFFVTDRVADVIDAGYTVAVISLTLAVIVVLRRRRVRRRLGIAPGGRDAFAGAVPSAP